MNAEMTVGEAEAAVRVAQGELDQAYRLVSKLQAMLHDERATDEFVARVVQPLVTAGWREVQVAQVAKDRAEDALEDAQFIRGEQLTAELMNQRVFVPTTGPFVLQCHVGSRWVSVGRDWGTWDIVKVLDAEFLAEFGAGYVSPMGFTLDELAEDLYLQVWRTLRDLHGPKLPA